MPTLLIPRERAPGERRVAATPETVRRLQARGFTLQVEQGAGLEAGFADSDFAAAGAELLEQPSWESVDGVLCVQTPAPEALSRLRDGALLAGLLQRHQPIAFVPFLAIGGAVVWFTGSRLWLSLLIGHGG